MTTYTKGDRVTLITHWSRKDHSFVVRDAVVHSCGKKQMTLLDAETGEMMGRNFRPWIDQAGGVCIATTTMEYALDLAERLSALHIDEEIARTDRTVEHYRASGSAGDSYFRHMANERAHLVELQARGGLAHRYSDAHAAVVAMVNARA